MKKRPVFTAGLSLLLSMLCLLPYLYIVFRSLSADVEFTVEYYYQVFLARPQYLLSFWKSLALALIIAAVQLAVSVLAGYGFAKCSFPGKNAIFFMLMLLMIMPLQVTLVPSYLMLESMKLLNSYAALALPAMFVPLGTFIMTQSFKSVPNEIIEAARLDGCSTLPIIIRIACPMTKSGLVCTLLLSFLDGWNMVEQPLVYLEDFVKYPMSVALASVPPESPALQLVSCVLAALPPIFLFAYFNHELVEGIAIGGGK